MDRETDGRNPGKVMKSPLASKTLWFNTIGALIVVVQQIMPAFPQDSRTYGVLAAVLAIGNAILRFYTKEAIK